jgi:hypothetical protein
MSLELLPSDCWQRDPKRIRLKADLKHAGELHVDHVCGPRKMGQVAFGRGVDSLARFEFAATTTMMTAVAHQAFELNIWQFRVTMM